MPQEFDNTNRFVLFRQERRTGESEQSPEYRGKINIEGQEWYLSGWLRKARDGKMFLSGTVQSASGASVPDQERDF